MNFVNTTGDFLLAQLVNAKAHTLPHGAQGGYIAAFYGNWVPRRGSAQRSTLGSTSR